MMIAIAFESVVKLVAFVLVGFFCTFELYDGFDNLFTLAKQDLKSPPYLVQTSQWGLITQLILASLHHLSTSTIPRTSLSRPMRRVIATMPAGSFPLPPRLCHFRHTHRCGWPIEIWRARTSRRICTSTANDIR